MHHKIQLSILQSAQMAEKTDRERAATRAYPNFAAVSIKHTAGNAFRNLEEDIRVWKRAMWCLRKMAGGVNYHAAHDTTYERARWSLRSPSSDTRVRILPEMSVTSS